MEKQIFKPRIVRGRVEMWTPHNGGEIAFSSPPVGPDTYPNVGKQILDRGLQVPTGDSMASLLHAVYCQDSIMDECMDKREFKDVKDKMKKGSYLWVFNRNFWTSKGVYVLQDLNATGRSQPLDVENLEKMLSGGRELSWGGIRFSEDKRVRFAPKGSYTLRNQSSGAIAKNGYMIASCDVEGAEKMGEVSDKFPCGPFIYGCDIKEGQEPEQWVSSVFDNEVRLNFNGNDRDNYNNSLAFGFFNQLFGY